MNLEKARFNMIEQQVRPWNVSDERVRQLLAEVPREAFAPAKYRDLAFADIELPLLDDEALARQRGQVMLPPRVQARLLQELRLQGGERVLHVGTGSGYMAALLGRQAASVFTIEIDNAIAAFAQANLQRAGADNVQVLVGDAAQTAPLPQGPFDAIVLSGSVARAPQHLIAQLAPGGRLLAITGDEPVMRATLVQLQGEGVRLTQPWDCDAPRLMNFPDTPVFHF